MLFHRFIAVRFHVCGGHELMNIGTIPTIVLLLLVDRPRNCAGGL